jgi:hypothetical protein
MVAKGLGGTDSQSQPGRCLLDGQDLLARGHPEHISELCLPEGWRPRFVERRHQRLGLVDVLLGAEQQVGDDVRIYDRFHERPASIRASTSVAVGRRV